MCNPPSSSVEKPAPESPNQKTANTTLHELALPLLNALMEKYWNPMYKMLESRPELIPTVTGFLINHQELSMYIGRTHFAVEYHGSPVLEKLPEAHELQLHLFDYSQTKGGLFNHILGFSSDSTLDIDMPLPEFSEGLLFATNRGWDKIFELHWNLAAQSSLMSFNSPIPEPCPHMFCRIVNGRFFDASESGLVTRHIKWMDFYPISYDDSDEKYDKFSFRLPSDMSPIVEQDVHYVYPIPTEFKFVQLPKINRFIELWGNSTNHETHITSFLAEKDNSFILTMKFGAIDIKSEISCEWQSEHRDPIKPDFFVVQPNGFADIVEFKLPDVPGDVIVGRKNRESFAAWLTSYVSQTRVYSTYFDDPNNRRWVAEKYGLKVLKPKRWLVVGRRSDFEAETWRELVADFRDLDILNFDDLVDGVTAQFYR